MRTTSSLVAAAGLALLTTAPVAAADDFEQTTFEARVGDVRLQSQLIEQGRSNDDRARVSVPARLFDPPIRIEDVRDDAGGHGPLVDFLADYWRANIEADANTVVSYWCEGERTGIRRLVSNEELFERNRRILRERPGLTIVGLVRHEQTTSVLRQHGGAVVGVTVNTGDAGPCLVNAPDDDLELAIIEASFR